MGWSLQAGKTTFQCETFDVHQDELEVSGHRQNYAYLVSQPAVIIVPVTPSGEIVTLRQYRYPVDEWCIETPAGGTHDTGDKSLEDVARDELREEIGGTAEIWSEVGAFYTTPSVTTEKCHVFLAENVQLEQNPDREATEKIKIEPRPAAEVIRLAQQGKMQTAPCALAVLMCAPILRERGYLE